ncbi:MAG: endonuclease [Paludibacteraceae bacterium]|nr:endonuclease [Paludibacteraceae bacterium]
MKRPITFLLTALLSVTMTAETYTIVFNSGNGDSSTATSELTSIVLSATSNCVDKIVTANKIYRAKEGYGIKGGTGSAKGELTLGLDDTYTISTLTVYAAAYVPTNGADTADNKRLVVCGQELAWETGHKAEIRPYTITLNQSMSTISIAAKVASSNRWYVQKIEFEAEDPHPTQAILEMQYPKMNFGGVKWESEDEPMEDVLNFYITGKHIDGNISLSLKNGQPFTLSEATLPANGGEVDIFYSITLKQVTGAIPYNDVVVAKATGLDGIERTRELQIELTVVPPSSGASTFNLDTTRMAIGDMPGNYYKYAQHTADSTLKNHLGYIICCGKRYRYGSGPKKTWDAFYYTDRDVETNQVLDMYSNNVRYFNPDKPTASVNDFDIEHMLPKSWWGGDVNPAYCDLFHLVPGDYSANRSKSNHAPGIPGDSTFNNGSFVTGSGAAYGLPRVFCPADQYKGDFARAYFYIAACYGDSLTWLEKGEPGIAMTNEGWEEFRPWLRDLLLEWHRMDPVSDKELKRAIEVNKIQGNRNPFIDYPELVEYIWGNKRGQAVDFSTLTQSYGTAYDEHGTSLSTAEQTPVARKTLRDGHLYITVGERTYSILGQ